MSDQNKFEVEACEPLRDPSSDSWLWRFIVPDLWSKKLLERFKKKTPVVLSVEWVGSMCIVEYVGEAPSQRQVEEFMQKNGIIPEDAAKAESPKNTDLTESEAYKELYRLIKVGSWPPDHEDCQEWLREAAQATIKFVDAIEAEKKATATLEDTANQESPPDVLDEGEVVWICQTINGDTELRHMEPSLDQMKFYKFTKCEQYVRLRNTVDPTAPLKDTTETKPQVYWRIAELQEQLTRERREREVLEAKLQAAMEMIQKMRGCCEASSIWYRDYGLLKDDVDLMIEQWRKAQAGKGEE